MNRYQHDEAWQTINELADAAAELRRAFDRVQTQGRDKHLTGFTETQQITVDLCLGLEAHLEAREAHLDEARNQ